MRKLKLFLSLLMLMAFSVGNVWGDSYTITLKNGTSSSDSSTGIQGSTTISDFVSEGASYVSAVAGSGKVFQGATGYGLKFGNSSGGGSITLTLTETVKPTSIVVNASQYGASEGEGVFQGTKYDMTGGGGKGKFKDYTIEYDGNTEVTTISVGCSKRGYVKSITVNYGGSTPPTTCTSEITITKADDPANGTFVIDNSGEVCIDEGNATVNVTATPNTGYHLATVSSTAGTVGAIDGNTCAITGINANTTISVTFAENPKYTVTWNVNGDESITTQVYEGSKPVFPATPVSCDGTSTTFVGWATAPWTGKIANLNDKTVYTSADAMPAVSDAVTYYAVFAKSSGAAGKLFNWEGGSSADFKALDGVELSADSKDYAAENAPYLIKWNGTGKYAIIAVDSQPGKVSFGVKMIGGATSSTVTVQESTAADGTFTDVETLTISGSSNDVVNLESTKAFKSTTRAIKLYYTKGSNVGLGPISIEGAVSYSDYITTCAEIKNAVTFAAPAGGTLSIMNGEDAVATGAQIVEGTALTVTATPDAENHYIGGAIKVVKTSDESDVTASVLKGSTLTMPNYAITVSATFTPTYAINLVAEGGSIALEYANGGAADGYAIAGTEIMATATADDAHEFASLALSENVTIKDIDANVAMFTMPAEAVTVTATFNVKSTPTIATDVTEVAFDATDYKGELAAKTFYVNGVALAEGNLTIACDNDAFTVSPTSIPVNGALEDTEITVTPKTTACGTFNATITISGGNAAAKEISVSLTVNKLASNLAWSAAEATVTIDANDNVFPTLTNPRKLPVVYSSLDDEVASIDENGAVTLKKAGETLIIVNFAGNDTVTALAEDALYYTLIVQQKYTAKWFVNGEELTESTQTAVAGTDLIVPTNPTKLADDCDDMVFKGWAEAAIVSKQDDAPTYTTKTKMPEANVNFYAVFASEVPGKDVTIQDHITPAVVGKPSNYTDWTGKTATSSAVYAGTSTGGESYIQIRSNDAKSGVVSTTSGGKVTKITVAWNSSTANGRTLNVYGKNTAYESSIDLYTEDDGTLIGSIVYGTSTELTISDDYTYIGIRSNSGAMYLDEVVIDWKVPGETTYTNYMTTCPSCPKVNLLKAATEHGSYTFQQSGIAVTSVKTCEAAATVDVVFAPELGYELANFQISELDGVSYADGVLTIAQNAAGNLTTSAAFALKNYSVAMTQTGGASATLSEDQAGKHMGDEITISTTLPEGYYFVGWEATPAVVFADATAPNTTFTMPAGDVTVTAKFTKILTIAEAADLIDADHSAKHPNSVVEGYIAGNISYSKDYHSITYNIQAIDANGFLSGKTIKVYSGKGLNNTEFDSENDVKVGAKVRVLGELMWYSKEEVYEINYNNYQLSYVEAADPSVVVYGDATKKNYYYNEDFKFDGLKAKQVFENGYAVEIVSPVWSATPEKVTATGNVAVTAEYEDITSAPFDVAVIKVLRQANIAWSATEADAYVVAQPYELPTLSNPNSLTVSYSSMTPDVADFAGESLQLKAAGEAVIKAAFAGNEEYEAAEVSYTLHVYGLESVTVEGNADVTAYEAGEAFNYAGLTAMANYRASETLTRSFVIPNEDVAWSADPAAIEASTTTVTVSATWLGKTGSKDINVAVYTHKITFEAPANGSLAVKNGEEAIASGDEFAKGTVLNIEVSPAIGYKLATLTVNGNDIKAEKQFTVGTELQYEVVATFVPKAEAGIEWKDTDGDKVYVGYMEVKGDEIDDSDLPELDNPNGLSIVYSSDNTAVAEIDPATGVITPKANGSTTISATFAGDDDYLSAEVSFDLNVEIIEPEFYVIGSFNSWAKFVPVYDWFYEFEDLTPGDYQLKVTTAPNWDDLSQVYGYDALTIKHAGLSKDNDGNICFTISNESGMNFVSVEFEKNEEGLSRFAVIGTYVKPTFTVVGVEALVGYNWDAGLNEVENEMLEDPETGNYELEKEDVMLAAGDYEYQVAMNHNWRGVDNSKLTITESGRYNVTFTFVPSTGATSAVAELQEAIVVIPTVAVKGSWNEWAASTTLTPAENKETASVTIELAAGSYEFGMEINSNWTANGSAFTRDANSKAVSDNTGNMTIVADVAGEYTFTWTFDGNLLSIAYPELPDPEYYIAGDFTYWGTNKVKMTEDNSALVATVSISSTEEQTFKVLRVQGPYETWYGLEYYAKMTSENCTDWTIGGGESNIGLEPTKAGEYTFVFVPAELKLTVNMPAKGSGTALDNTEADTKAVKTMENGVLIIRRGDKTYNGQGQLLK